MSPADLHLQTMRITEESIASLSRQPERRGFLPLNYRSYVRAASGYALRMSRGPEEYVRRLAECSPIQKLVAFLDFQSSGDHPALFARFSAEDVDLIAVPLCLGDRELALRFLNQFLVPGESTPFWCFYVQGLRSVAEKTPYSSNVLIKPKGIERHWLLYLQLMERIASGLDTRLISADISASFARCNNDGRLLEVTHIDPSGTYPVSWDLRSVYISKLASAT